MLNAALAEPTARTAPTRQASCLSRVRVLAVLTSTSDKVSEEAAADRLANREPAFWSLSTYSDAPGIALRDLCNEIGPERAVEENPRFTLERLERVLPLNKAAAYALCRAFVHFGTFRYADELLARTDHAETLPAKTDAMAKLVAFYRANGDAVEAATAAA